MLTKEWIGGFISGEGCFTFFNNYTPVCQITLSKKDSNILYEIQNFLQLGIVSVNINAVFKVSKVNECLKLINKIDESIHGDKLIDYENWKLGINFINFKPKGELLSKKDKRFLDKLKPRQNKIRKLFTKKDIPNYSKIIRICKKCEEEFFSNSGGDFWCKQCKPNVKKKYMREYMRKYLKKNPEYFRNIQRKRLNIPKERWKV